MMDKKLLTEYLRTKDNGLFTMLYDRMYAGLCAVARRIAPKDAEDVVQDAFCKLHELKPREITSGFMVKMVQNLAICRNRRTRKRNEVSLEAVTRPDRNHMHGGCDEPMDDGDSPDVQLQKKESWEDVKAALDFLPPEQKEAVETYFDRGRTIVQTAEILSADPEATRTRIRRGVADLPKYIILGRRGKKAQRDQSRKARPYPRPIRAIDPESGVVVREFARLYDAIRPGDSRSSLYVALREGRVYKGLKWSYASAT